MLAWIGVEMTPSPLNLSVIWAAVCCVLVWAFVWHTRWGYEIRTVGANETAAVYAGIDPRRVIMLSMCLSGALAGRSAERRVGQECVSTSISRRSPYH